MSDYRDNLICFPSRIVYLFIVKLNVVRKGGVCAMIAYISCHHCIIVFIYTFS